MASITHVKNVTKNRLFAFGHQFEVGETFEIEKKNLGNNKYLGMVHHAIKCGVIAKVKAPLTDAELAKIAKAEKAAATKLAKEKLAAEKAEA